MKYKIKEKERFLSSPKEGMSQSWIEYQVWEGRRIVSRQDTYEQAEKWIEGREDG